MPSGDIIRDDAYLKYLRTQPCLLTGRRGSENETVDPMHIGTAGKGIKTSDAEAIPVLHRFHAAGHNGGEMTMLRRELPDWMLRDAMRMYARKMYQDYLDRGRK